MQYKKVVQGQFVERPNRFIAHVQTGGERVVAHVKNTGRCRELLLPGATVYLEHAPHPGRKTGYSLIAVQKGERLINIDSQAPNRAAEEALRAGWVPEGLTGPITGIRREIIHGKSRLDFFFRADGYPVLMEVKGVTLEEDGIALFPDAPTERGLRHLHELIRVAGQGIWACVLFVIQMENVQGFKPNDYTHPAFGDALRRADKAGVLLRACNCRVTPDTLWLGEEIPIEL